MSDPSAWRVLAKTSTRTLSPGDRFELALGPHFADDPQPDTGSVRCSGLQWDARHWYFRLMQAPKTEEKADPKRDRVLSNGTKFHDRVQEAMTRLQREANPWDVQIVAVEGYDPTEYKREIYPGVVLSGHLDGVVEIEGVTYVVELKSMGSRWWRTIKQPLVAHRWQATGYHRLTDGWPTLFVYENKDTQEWKHFVFHPDGGWVGRLDRKLHTLSDALRDGVAPAYCVQDTEDDTEWIVGACNKCPFQTHCFAVGVK